MAFLRFVLGEGEEYEDYFTGEILTDGDSVVAKVDVDASGWAGNMDNGYPDEDSIEFVCGEETFYDNYYCCDDCGCYVPNGDITSVDDNQSCVCQDCLDEDYHRCDLCGEYFYSVSQDRYHTICENCLEDSSWEVCGRCDCIFDSDSEGMYTDEYGWCCDDCAPEDSVHPYSYKPEPIFYDLDDARTHPYMGVELEVDDGRDKYCVADLYDEDDIYCKDDGSLSAYGFEIVSHPRTLSAHKDYCWDDIMDTCRNSGYRSHNAEECGLHVHVNRDFFASSDTCGFCGIRTASELAASKIIIIFAKYWDSFILPFTRRRKCNIDHWAGLPTDYIPQEGDTIEDIQVKMKGVRKSKYYAINLKNSDTLEFRIFRGTLNHNTFMATLEFVDGLCRYVKKTTLSDVMNATIGSILSDEVFSECEYLMQYIADRGINITELKVSQTETN